MVTDQCRNLELNPDIYIHPTKRQSYSHHLQLKHTEVSSFRTFMKTKVNSFGQIQDRKHSFSPKLRHLLEVTLLLKYLGNPGL